MNKNQEMMAIYWEQGLGVTEISKKLNLATGYISRFLNKIYGETREKRYITKYRVYPINENFFEEINCEANAYFLGLLAADGCLTTGNTSVRIGLQYKDVDILKRFIKELNTEKPLYFSKANPKRNSQPQYILEFSSQKMRKDLERHGLTTRKSLTLELFENILTDIFHHYIRGYFDGDGCVSWGEKVHHAICVTFVGSHKFCEKLTIFLNSINISSRATKSISKNYSYTNIRGANNILRFYDFIYKDATIFLDRKKNKFDKWIEYRNNNKGSHNKAILQYDLNGEFIKEWATTAMAARFLNRPYLESTINGCCRGRFKQAGGFKWKYKTYNYDK